MPGLRPVVVPEPRASRGAAIVSGERALVTVRAREPYRGKVDVPGGFLELGEHPVDGLKREVREELGLEIEVDPTPVLLAPTRTGPRGYGRWRSGSGRACWRARLTPRTTWRTLSGSARERWTA